MVNSTRPDACPRTLRPSGDTVRYSARKPDQGHRRSLCAKSTCRYLPLPLSGMNTGRPSKSPCTPMPLSTVMLITTGIASANSDCLQKGHMKGQLVRSTFAGTADARGLYVLRMAMELMTLMRPWPCSYMCWPGPGTAPSTSACFMDAGLSRRGRASAGTTDASRHTAPATTGDATLVPLSVRQPPWILLPDTSFPYAVTSGLARP
mmetsp:Transcript_10378/g.26613  ORF Transcript_10378/g.26613 Transcript_10378/m.26613 type:complete len:206 (+) Transcript_10378:1712-2329(+)